MFGFGKKEFWVMYGKKLADDQDLMRAFAMYAEIQGVRVIRYGVKTIEEKDTGKPVQKVCMVHVKELWHGGMKRFLRDQKKEETGCRYKELKVFG